MVPERGHRRSHTREVLVMVMVKSELTQLIDSSRIFKSHINGVPEVNNFWARNENSFAKTKGVG